MLIAVVLSIDSSLSLFLQVSITGVILLTQANVSRLGFSSVQVAQGLVRFRTLTFIGLNVRHGLPHTVERVILLSQAIICRLEPSVRVVLHVLKGVIVLSLANIYIGSNRLLWAALQREILSGMVRDCEKLPETEIDCIALASCLHCSRKIFHN